MVKAFDAFVMHLFNGPYSEDEDAMVPSIYVSGPNGLDSLVPENNNNYKTSIHDLTPGNHLRNLICMILKKFFFSFFQFYFLPK